MPNDNWQFSIGATFLDPVYDSFIEAEGVDGPEDLSGTAPGGVHEESISLALTRYWNAGGIDGFVRADYLYESDVQIVENVPASLASREVGVLNASIGFNLNDWQILLWGRNLTDDEFPAQCFPVSCTARQFLRLHECSAHLRPESATRLLAQPQSAVAAIGADVLVAGAAARL